MSSIVTLPDEILLILLLSPQLDYKDLKRISRTCKKLHTFEKAEELDSKMFRKGLPPPPPPPSSSSTAKDKVVLVEKGTKVKYHPNFNEANLIPDLFEPVTVHLAPRRVEDGLAEYTELYKHDGSYWEDRYIDVEQLPCNKELATSPPCRRFYLNFGGGSLVENETGVTVDDAISTAVEIWESEPDEETREEWEERSEERRRYYAREKQQHMVELELEIGRDLTWRYILGERNGWQ